jgi:hypothetical protein
MTELERLEEALKALGYEVYNRGDTLAAARGSHETNDRLDLNFYRRQKGEGFSTESSNLEALKAVQRKYTEIGVRAFAKKRGFTVSVDGLNKGKLILTNRRNG